jgi:predicted O-methyltransferase YrrM
MNINGCTQHWRHVTGEIRARLAASPLARVLALGPRSLSGSRHMHREAGLVAQWLVSSREHTNYTYDLTPVNVDQLVWFVSSICGSPFGQSEAMVLELINDHELRKAIQEATESSPRRGISDSAVRYGRRLAWYAIIRLTKPALVVETGTDKGLGSLVIGAALLKNGQGHLITIDNNVESGQLLRSPYSDVVDRRVGDSLEVLANLGNVIDLFIHDSDHSAGHERSEFDIVHEKLAADSLVLSDNAHETSELSNWSKDNGRRFLYFAEQPLRHWSRGAGVGISY